VLTGLVFHTDGLQLTATAVCFWEQVVTTWRLWLGEKASCFCLSG